MKKSCTETDGVLAPFALASVSGGVVRYEYEISDSLPDSCGTPTVSRPDIAEFGEGENTGALHRRGRELARRSVYLHPQRRKYGSRHRKIVILLQTFAVPHPEFRLGGAACQ